jgi:hypothetical protein
MAKPTVKVDKLTAARKRVADLEAAAEKKRKMNALKAEMAKLRGK